MAVASRVTIGLAQWFPRPGDPEANLATAAGAVRSLAERGCDVAVLPELWLCGYRPSTLVDDAAAAAEPLDGPVGEVMATTAAQMSISVCAGSVPERRGGHIFNTSVLYDSSGDAVLVHRKVHLYGPEAAVFEPGSGFTTATLRGLGTAGICICFDGDFPESARTLRDRGARVVFHPCAYEVATRRWWDVLYPAQALSNGQWWISCNQLGGSGPNAFFGDSRVLAPNGEVRARAANEGSASDSPGSPEFVIVSVPIATELVASDAEASVLHSGRRQDAYVARSIETGAP